MSSEYVKIIEGAYRIGETRVPLDSVIYAFRNGSSAECIQKSFPTLTLEQVYGSIAYYLAHQDEVDRYLVEGEIEFEKFRDASLAIHRDWYEKMEQARKQMLTSHS